MASDFTVYIMGSTTPKQKTNANGCFLRNNKEK